jgi:preprotein translocase subunit SecY
MTLEDIKKNLNAIANSMMENPKKQVDSSVVLLLTIASTLVLMMDELIKKEDGKDESKAVSEEE